LSARSVLVDSFPGHGADGGYDRPADFTADLDSSPEKGSLAERTEKNDVAFHLLTRRKRHLRIIYELHGTNWLL